MNKIYIFICRKFDNGDVAALAVAEDGNEIAGHLSSTVDFAKFDMGITSKIKHEVYAEKYPAGYELEWVDDWRNHPFLSEQAKKNEAKNYSSRRSTESDPGSF